VKILDFGVAKLLDGGGGPTEVSVVGGHVLGTPSYMSPEHARAQPIDGRADVYAVGVMLFEMVTGRKPFEAEGKLGIIRMQVEDSPRSPREFVPALSEELEQAILRAMEKEREDRWESAVAFAAALGEVPEGRAGRPVTLRTGQTGEEAGESGSREIAGGYRDGASGIRRPARRERAGRRTRIGRSVLIGVLAAGLAGGALWGAVELGYLDVPIGWLSREPWADWRLP
jgi:hypothetical protein